MNPYRTSVAPLAAWVCALMLAPSIFAADAAPVATPDASAAPPQTVFPTTEPPSASQPFPPAPDTSTAPFVPAAVVPPSAAAASTPAAAASPPAAATSPPNPATSSPNAATSSPGAAASALPAAAFPPLIKAEGDEKFTLNFRNVPIEEAFELLSRKDKVNIIVSKGVSGQVSVNLYRVTLKEAIQSVANAAGYSVEMRNGDYVILAKDSNFELPATSLQIKTLKVQYSDTTQIATLLTKYASRDGKITPLLGRKLVVVEDYPAFVARIERLLEQLDAPPRQIMIEAKILEIALNENESFGIDWKRLFFLNSSANGSGSFGTSGLASGTAAAPGQGFFFSFLDNKVSLFFSALATAGRVRTLSTPKLLALENQEAKVIIGDSTGYSLTTTTNLVTTQTVQFLDSGVILKVIPSVDQRGRVVLKVQPEVSTVSVLGGIPSKKNIQVTTELICDDGQSIFIGGLIKATGSTERDGMPILKDVPFLGRLFSNSSEIVGKAETVVIITPYIVAQPSDLARESAAKVRQADDADSSILDLQLRLERGRAIP